MTAISQEQALDCFASDDLIGIGMEADAVRRRLHPEGVVSYAVEGMVDCAGDDAAVLQHIGEIVELGGAGVLLDCVVGRGVAGVERLLAQIHSRFPETQMQLANASEVASLAEAEGLTLAQTLERLRTAGVVSIHGAGSLEVHRAAHEMGLRTTAGLRIGAGESIAERVEALVAIAGLQVQTGGFVAFRLSSAESGRELDDPTAVEYLKTLAIARMMLANAGHGIEHIQANWQQQGLKVMQMSLRFGANDVGAAMGANEEQVRQVIRDAGFKPVQRDALYGAMSLA